MIQLDPMPKEMARLRGVAAKRGDAELSAMVERFGADLCLFFREPAEMDAPTMAAVHTAFCIVWRMKTDEEVFEFYSADDFARLRTAAMAMHRPREDGAPLQ